MTTTIETFEIRETDLLILFTGEPTYRRVDWATFREKAAGKLLATVASKLRTMPRKSQGLRVVVSTRTGGATWVAEVYDAAGDYRRDCMRADEGMDDPHQSLAIAGAKKMAKRLGCSVDVISLD